MSRPVKKLFDIEIDEVSVVDRPANQHGLIAIAKNDGANTQEGLMDLFDAEGAPVDADALEFGDVVFDDAGNEYEFVPEEDTVEQEPERELAGVGKSLGDSVLEQLSKAVSDTDREEIIAKALNEVSVVKAENERLAKALEAEQDARIEAAFIAKAAEYNLPVSAEVLGPILKAVAEVLTDDQLDVLDQLFESVGDTLYDEIGYVGDTDNVSVIDQVDAMAAEMVGKSDVSSAEAMVALLEANPAAYDAYLAENGR